MPTSADKLVKIKQITGLSALLPTADEKAALAGVSAPGSTNKYATAADIPDVRKVFGVRSETHDNFDITASDAGYYIRVDAGMAARGTVLDYRSAGWAIGTVITVEQTGADTVTLQGASGVTLNAYEGLNSAGQYATLQLICVAQDVWTVIGGVA